MLTASPRRIATHLAASLVLLVLCASSAQGADGAAHLTLVYGGNLNGELEPCGCARESNLGGIRRLTTKVQELRQQQPELVLISSGGLMRSDTPRDRINAEYIIKGLATLNYDAIGVQWQDLAYGAEFMRQAVLPWLSSNWLGEDFVSMREVQRAGVSLMIFSWLEPNPSLHPDFLGGQAPADTHHTKLDQGLRIAKAQGRITLLMTTLSLAEAQAQLPLAAVDILIIGGTSEEYGEPQWLGETLVLQPGTRGMRLGLIDITLGADQRITRYAHSVMRLSDSIPDAPSLAGWYAQYSAAVEFDYQRRVALRKARESGDSPYLGAKSCQTCHASAYEKWRESRHATAFDPLARVNKTFDPFCLGCHTVGYETPGGFLDNAISAHLVGVQCESCHGPAREHVRSNGTQRLNPPNWAREAVCGQCHQGPHSPAFRFEDYWPRVRHGGR